VRKIALAMAVVVALLVLYCTPSSNAQTTDKCTVIEWTVCFWTQQCIPLGGYYIGPGPGNSTVAWAAHSAACPPIPKCHNCPQAGSPIILGDGDTFIAQTDVALPGLGGGITLRRTWNSFWPPTEVGSSIGMFGPNWRSTYEERVFMDSDNYLTYARGDGNYWTFGSGGNGMIVASPANVSATIAATNSTWTIAFQNGEQRQFNPATGLLTAIIDRNGNATQLTYDSSNRLVTVTDPASRHLYFNYANSSSLLVTSVTSDFGITLSYAYDSLGRLVQVTKPDLTTVSFTYNAQSQITAVTDNNGKILESHTYDSSGRGLTSSQANGVNAVTVTYPPPPPAPPLYGQQ